MVKMMKKENIPIKEQKKLMDLLDSQIDSSEGNFNYIQM